MSDLDSTNEVRAALDPVWFNTYWVKNALGLYEGVSKHAEELNVDYGLFFGAVQKLALDAAVIGLSKLYDTSNPAYRKDTVPALLGYLKDHVTSSYIARIKLDTLTGLGMEEPAATQLVADLKVAFDQTKVELIETMEGLLPSVRKDAALRRLLTYRNKIGAHQERLDEAQKGELRLLPSLNDMERLNRWAVNCCMLCMSLLTPNVALAPNVQSTRIAALNVAAKLLQKTFARWEDEEAFFSRI